uniref:6-phosphogluconate dehydrogenase, decarboxylating n=1 Tax=Ascaris lumbricoides TaxID=6252 RepID=A0A9J2P7I2_ASCLU
MSSWCSGNTPASHSWKMSEEAVADIAVVGLAVMGQNLILNMNDKGFVVCAFNRTVSKVDDFLANEAKGTKIIGVHSFEEMAKKLKRPRRVLLLVKAGEAVDSMIAKMLPYLEKGDIIIDAGNSEYTDTNRRFKELGEKGFLFVGSGVSGGEEGARHGPSLMPGGAPEAWPYIKEIFQNIAAKVGSESCCDWVSCKNPDALVGEAGAGHFVKMVHNGIEYGDMQLIGEAYSLLKDAVGLNHDEMSAVGEAGAGHFVKMVHNGIEYGDMQLIGEAYSLLKDAVGLNHDEMSAVFDEWNKGELDSYLIQITAEILRFKDEKGQPLLPQIRDTAGQKGTGKWTGIAALTYGIPVTLIGCIYNGEAVFARCLSSLKSERVAASKILVGPKTKSEDYVKDKKEFIEHIRKALYASKIVSYAQGFMLIAEASRHFDWKLNFGAIALMWRGGCIIRSRFLGDIKRAFDENPKLTNLLLDKFFTNAIHQCQDSWRKVCATSTMLGIPTPAFSTALAFYDGYRHEVLPANLIQAQRDYFGAHTYEMMWNPGKFVHTNWTGTGGRVTSNTYTA